MIAPMMYVMQDCNLQVKAYSLTGIWKTMSSIQVCLVYNANSLVDVEAVNTDDVQ